MAEDSNSVLLTILNKSYRVNCSPEDRSSLMESARILDERMFRIQSRGTNLDREQIAVMVALNITNELLNKQSGGSADTAAPALNENRLAELEEKLERALEVDEEPQA